MLGQWGKLNKDNKGGGNCNDYSVRVRIVCWKTVLPVVVPAARTKRKETARNYLPFTCTLFTCVSGSEQLSTLILFFLSFSITVLWRHNPHTAPSL